MLERLHIFYKFISLWVAEKEHCGASLCCLVILVKNSTNFEEGTASLCLHTPSIFYHRKT